MNFHCPTYGKWQFYNFVAGQDIMLAVLVWGYFEASLPYIKSGKKDFASSVSKQSTLSG